MDYAKRVGYAGTWGPGFNAQNTIHVQDLADAIMLIFKAALEGRADEGANGFCKWLAFKRQGICVSDGYALPRLRSNRHETLIRRMGASYGRREIQLLSYVQDVLTLCHQYLYSKGVTKEPGAKPMPAEIVEPLGHCKYTFLWTIEARPS